MMLGFILLLRMKLERRRFWIRVSLFSLGGFLGRFTECVMCCIAVGIVRLVLHQAKELDQSKSLSGDLNPFGKIYLNHNTTSSFQTKQVKHTTSPVWESPFEFLCTDKVNAIITVKVVDDRDFLKDPVVGYMSIKLVDLIEAKKTEARDWFPLSGCRQGKVRVSAEWKPIAMEGAIHGTGMYSPPIGVVRLVLERATDMKNVEAMLGGKVRRNFLIFLLLISYPLFF